jgi:hypothetical protein
MDCDFCTQNVTPLLSHLCEVTYDDFLRKAGVPHWRLTILGQEASKANVSVTDPDGRNLTETVALSAITQQEIHRLLLTSYDLWNAFNWKRNGTKH